MISKDRITEIFYSMEEFCKVFEPAIQKNLFPIEKNIGTGPLAGQRAISSPLSLFSI